MSPSENIKLYGIHDYFNCIVSLYHNKKMPNKILLSGKKGLGKSTLSYHIINYILSENEENKYNAKSFSINPDNKSYKLILNKSHPNFHLVDLLEDKKSIDINQIRRMISYTNKSSFNDMPRFILIDNVEKLNNNSINALLKVIEEPNKNIYFILIHNNERKILPTLKSRCLIFKITLPANECLKITNLILNNDIFNFINVDLVSYYNTPGELISLINFANEKKLNLKEHNLKSFLNILIHNGYYKKNKFAKNLIINFIELYFIKEYKASAADHSLLKIYHNFIDKVSNTEKFNLDEENLFSEFKTKILNG